MKKNTDDENLHQKVTAAAAYAAASVTILGYLLDFGLLFKAWATISLPKSTTFLGNF